MMRPCAPFWGSRPVVDDNGSKGWLSLHGEVDPLADWLDAGHVGVEQQTRHGVTYLACGLKKIRRGKGRVS